MPTIFKPFPPEEEELVCTFDDVEENEDDFYISANSFDENIRRFSINWEDLL